MVERIRREEGRKLWGGRPKRDHVQRLFTLWRTTVTGVDSDLENILLLNAVFFWWPAYQPQEYLTQTFHDSRIRGSEAHFEHKLQT